MTLTVIERAQAAGDWHIGYLDGKPAIGNRRGEWFLLNSDAFVHNPGQSLIWVVKLDDGVWECIHEKLWPQGEPIPAPDTGTQPDYVEGDGEAEEIREGGDGR